MDMDFSSLFNDLDFSLLDENSFTVSNTKPMKNASSDSAANDKHALCEGESKPTLLPSVSNDETKAVSTNCMNTPSSISLSEDALRVKASAHDSRKRIKIRPVCNKCLKSFATSRSLRRHEILHDKEKTQLFKCNLCEFTYTRKDQLNSHLKDYQNTPYVCTICNEKFCRSSTLKAHISSQHLQSTEMLRNENAKCENASNIFSSIAFKCCDESNLDISDVLNKLKSKVENELLHQFNKRKPIKCFLTVEGHVTDSLQCENTKALKLYIDSTITYIFSKSDIPIYINKAFNEIIEQFSQLKTEWTLKNIERLTLCTIQYNVF